MAHYIEISNLGPIDYCELDIDGFTVFTGPQASGKSTTAKAVYFFRTIKDDILDLALTIQSFEDLPLILSERLGRKFANMFGNDLSCYSTNMNLKYFYEKGNDEAYIKVYFHKKLSVVSIGFGQEIQQLLVLEISNLNALNRKDAVDILKTKLSDVFRDDYETIYIPSGRSTITLLSDHFPYLLAKMEDWQLNSIDYCTRKYIELILKIRPWFSERRVQEVNESKKLPILEIQRLSRNALDATYQFVNNEERLYFTNRGESEFVKINYSSSGQQEAIWVFNLLIYFQVEGKKVFTIIEEPEAHLHPEAQYMLSKGIATFCKHTKSQAIITTHSPYVLSSLNNLIYAGKIGGNPKLQSNLSSIIPEISWLAPNGFSAFIFEHGKIRSIKDEDLAMIDLEELDAVAARHDEEYEKMLFLSAEVR